MNWYDVFDKETIEDIKNNRDNLDQLLTTINELTTHAYDLGYCNGYVAGSNNDYTEVWYMIYFNIIILNMLTILFNITLSIYVTTHHKCNYDKFIIYIAFILSASAIICDMIYMVLD